MPSFPHQAIVLAAGLGTRLLPITEKSPKPLLPIGGVPILLFNLYLLKQAGIQQVTINLHHRPEKIRGVLKDGRKLGLRLRYSLEPRILGTAGGIAQALAHMEKSATFVLNGDILFDLDLRAFAAVHHKAGAQATLACISKNQAKVSSFVEHDARGRIFRIAGDPPLSKPHPRLHASVFSGAHLLEPELFSGYPQGRFGCVVRQIYQPALARGAMLQAYLHGGSWWDLGNFSEWKQVDQGLWRGNVTPTILELWNQVQAWSRKLFA